MPPSNRKTSQNGEEQTAKERTDVSEDDSNIAVEDGNADKETEELNQARTIESS